MPATYSIDVGRQLVLSRAWGLVTDDDLMGHRMALVRDTAFTKDYYHLYDFSEVTEWRASTATVRLLASTSPFSTLSRIALLASSDATFGMARLAVLSAGADEQRYRVFRDRAAAFTWLEREDLSPGSGGRSGEGAKG